MAVVALQEFQDQSREMLTRKDIAQHFGVSHETARKIVRMPGFPLFQQLGKRKARSFSRFLTLPVEVGSRAGAPAVGGGFPVPLFRVRVGVTIPPWPRFQPPPRQTQRAAFPHCAFLLAAYRGL